MGVEATGATREHQVTIRERREMTVTGVEQGESFDEQVVVLQTADGFLTVHGRELHVQKLDVEEGCFSVKGVVTGLQYAEGGRRRERSQGLLRRLLR